MHMTCHMPTICMNQTHEVPAILQVPQGMHGRATVRPCSKTLQFIKKSIEGF